MESPEPNDAYMEDDEDDSDNDDEIEETQEKAHNDDIHQVFWINNLEILSGSFFEKPVNRKTIKNHIYC